MSMASRRWAWIATALLTCIVSCGASSDEAANASDQASATLYKRLGGFDAIAAVVDDFVPRLVADPQLARFFVGLGNDSKGRVRQLVVEMICQASGGPCVYLGRPMKTAHSGLGISEADWQTAMTHFGATLVKFKLAKTERDDLLALMTGLKKDIVEK